MQADPIQINEPPRTLKIPTVKLMTCHAKAEADPTKYLDRGADNNNKSKLSQGKERNKRVKIPGKFQKLPEIKLKANGSH